MNLNAITLAISRPGGVRSWDPLAMFTSGVQGVLYDPSDYSTLFQNAAGTTPVTAVEQPVGLMLDKSKGLVLGSEIFSDVCIIQNSGTSGSYSAGAISNSLAGASGYPRFRWAQPSLQIGKSYRVTVTQTGIPVFTTLLVDNLVITGAATTLNNSGTVTFTFTYTGVDNRIILYANGSVFSGTIGFTVKELPGNHAFNGSGNSANFPVLSARYNLLTKSEDFTGWSISNSTLTTNTITSDGVAAAHGAYQAISATNSTYVFSVEAKPNGTNFITLACNTGTVQQYCSATFNVSTGVMTKSAVGSGAGAIVSTSCVASADGYYKCTIVFTLTVVNANIYLATNGTPTLDDYGRQVFTQSGLSAYVRKADLRVANDALGQPAYQRVNTSTDYDTVGFKPYLRFNGTNQWLQTNSIDFSLTDKMFVSAGVRKLSGVGANDLDIITELSTNSDVNNGSFVLIGDNSYNVPYGYYQFNSRGTSRDIAVTTSSTYAAPITNVLSGIGNISGDQAILRVNGTQAAISTTDQGTGNYGNYPLFIGARAGSSFWFNGRLYGMVVAGKQASAAEITSTETYLNQKTGAF